MPHDERAFTLIELLIVVSIILIIASIAIPNLMRSRMAANHASAIGSMRTINTSEVMYATTYGQGYSRLLVHLGPPMTGSQPSVSAAGLLDAVLAAGSKSGYGFTYTATDPDPSGRYQGYKFNGNPSLPGSTGSFYYYSDQTTVIHGSLTGVASAADPAIAE